MEELEYKTPMYEIVKVRTSSDDGPVIYMGQPSGGKGRHVIHMNPPSGGEGGHVIHMSPHHHVVM